MLTEDGEVRNLEHQEHCVFTDPRPEFPSNVPYPDEISRKRCFGNNCSVHAFGGPHRCPTGRCKREEDALINWMKESNPKAKE